MKRLFGGKAYRLTGYGIKNIQSYNRLSNTRFIFLFVFPPPHFVVFGVTVE
ncbi:MAG: hypothetical protein LBJ00_03825 [Planctomycetaceae bacterium]|nr:hypothetical protein [Planctomycetaceae bacterium]